MNAIICLDDNNGIMFNGRRQSRDSVLNQRVIDISKESRLLMSTYSAKLFPDCGAVVDGDFLNIAGEGDFCFIEEKMDSLENIESLYIFLWNRHYPADVYFDFDLENEGFSLESQEDFPGSSHEKITLKIYKR